MNEKRYLIVGKKALEMQHVYKAYKKINILQNINLSIPKSAICGLIGENGAGKSTIMKLIAGTSYASSGNIYINSKDVTQGNQEERRNMGCLIEHPTIYNDMTAWENLEIQRVMRGIPGRKCIDEVLEAVDLCAAANQKAGKYSLGMKQRLGIAIAMLGEPEFLILDEPMNGLDPEKIHFIRKFLLKRNKEYHTTILISSHILEELRHMATMYCFIHKGHILESVTKSELDERCRLHMDIKVNNIPQVCAILENKLRISEINVTDNGKIQIFEMMENPEIISRCIVENGFDLYELAVRQETLENYYMNLLLSADE